MLQRSHLKGQKTVEVFDPTPMFTGGSKCATVSTDKCGEKVL